jgi:hypothetical protein
MTYLLYRGDRFDPRVLSRLQAQRVLSTSTYRFYATSCSCAHCRVYVLRSEAGVVTNLRIANAGCTDTSFI